MKKLLALVLAALMALSLAAAASALEISPDPTSGDPTEDPVLADGRIFYFGGSDETYEDVITPAGGFVPVTVNGGTYFALENGEDKYTVSATVSSNKPEMISASISRKTIGTTGNKGVKLVLKLDPADSYFTVQEHTVKIKLVVVQKKSEPNTEALRFEEEYEVTVKNYSHGPDEFYSDANNRVTSVYELSNPVIEAEVFTDVAKDKALTLDYGNYAIKFSKVSRQNTALYLKASTDVVSVENTKAIGSISFKPTRVKDAATITMPISPDNENYYGETVYVYAVTDGKPTGAAIKADVANHSYVVFTVPAGTTLGTFAAYGSEKLGDAEKPAPTKNTGKEKPAIPETGVGDIVNLAVVFAVVALAGVGFAIVKKAGR